MSIPISDLSEPFPQDAIKQRKGNFGNTLDYVESWNIIQRLNDVLEGRWSFRILFFQVDAEEVFVHGELKVDDTVRQQFGGSSITRKTDTKEAVSVADDLKAATADALKKCASAFGVGLYLYKPKSNGNGNGHGRISNKEITDLFTTCKANGIQQSTVIKTAQDVYKKSIAQLTSLEAKNLIEQLTRRQYATP